MGGDLVECEDRAEELCQGGEGGGRLREPENSLKRPLAVELRHLVLFGVEGDIYLEVKHLVVASHHHVNCFPHARVLAISPHRLGTVA